MGVYGAESVCKMYAAADWGYWDLVEYGVVARVLDD